MGEIAAPRRARSIGDLAFNFFAAGLALALLFATGRHLFGAPSVDRPQHLLGPVAATAVVEPVPRRVAPVSAPAKGSFNVAVSHGHPFRPMGSSAVAGSHGLTVRPIGSSTVAVFHGDRARPDRAHAASAPRVGRSVAPAATALKTAAPRRAAIRAETPLAARRGMPGSLQRAHSPVGARNAIAPKVKPRAKAIARTSPPAVTLRPRETSPVRVARLAPSRPQATRVPAANGARRSPGAATPRQISARARGPGVSKGRGNGRRPSAARPPSVIEPPLGYDARPALVLAPGAAQLELGESVIPTIRSKRRH